jgi:PAS domain S-box-containing protein
MTFKNKEAFVITGIYAFAGGLLILISDKLLTSHLNVFHFFSLSTGIKAPSVLVVISLIYVLLYAYRKTLLGEYQKSLQMKNNDHFRAQAAHLQALMDNLPFGLWAIGSDGRYYMQNTIHRETWGDIIGKRPEEWAPSQEVSEKWADDNRLAFTGKVVKKESEYAIGGERRLFYKIIAPISAGHNILGIMGINIDITDRKRAEEALRESEARWQFAIEGSNEGVWDRNIESGEVFFSRQWKEMLGFSEDEIGCDVDEWSKRVHTEDLPRVMGEIERHLRRETDSYSAEYRMQCKNGSYKWILARGKVISRKEDGGALRFVGTHSDMTERRNLEAQLQHSQKMEAVGLLAGGIAHDFNNILTAIIGYSHLIQARTTENDPVHNYARQIDSAAGRAAEMTRGLLAFSRKQVMVSKVVDLNKTVTELEKILRRLLNESIELRLNVLPEKLNVMADSGKLEQVLMNFVTNAKDAMPRGGILTISTSLMTMNGKFLHSHGYGAPGKYACIEVNDTGCGIDKETRKKIFEPYYTTKEVGKGTGLGLSIVFGIIKQHNGYINVYSEQGMGTTFRIYLPLVEVESEQQPVPDVRHPNLPGGTETILLVEDDPDVIKFHTTLFESAGYTVISAVDGEDALIRFLEHESDIDLVILDLIMPKMNGKDVFNILCKGKPTLKFIFMSGHPADVLNEAGAVQGTGEFIAKPVDPDVLLKEVREILDQESIDFNDMKPGQQFGMNTKLA